MRGSSPLLGVGICLGRILGNNDAGCLKKARSEMAWGVIL